MKEYRSLANYKKEYNLSELIVCDDITAWIEYEDYHHIYNKLWVAESQDLECGPMYVYPNEYPIIFKPIINLKGMSKGFKVINDEKEYDDNIKDGLFWEKYLDGNHYCVDLILVEGKIKYYTCLRSEKGDSGSFKYHESIPGYVLPIDIKYWVETYMDGYTGAANIEIIDDFIIEAHLRLNGDYYLYDLKFANKLNDLYEKNIWVNDYQIEKKYLIPVFVNNNFNGNLDKEQILEPCNDNGVISYFFYKFNSLSQSEFLKRIFMFDINDLNKGLELKKLIILNNNLKI